MTTSNFKFNAKWNKGDGKLSQTVNIFKLGNLSESNKNITLKMNPKFIVKECLLGTRETKTAQCFTPKR